MCRAVVAGVVAVLLLPSLLRAQDWQALDAEEEIRVHTQNEDGSMRKKTIWFVVVDAQPYIRPYSRTSWASNMKRNPDIVLEIARVEYPVRSEAVTEKRLVDRVQAAFREKYGFGDRITSAMSLLLGSKRIYRVESRAKTSPDGAAQQGAATDVAAFQSRPGSLLASALGAPSPSGSMTCAGPG